MSIFSSNSFDQKQNTSIVDDENFDNDDLVTFQQDSKTINFYYSQLTKYSKHIRDSYLFSDVIKLFPREIHKFQEEFQLLPENINYFFQLLQQNLNLNEDSNLTYVQCMDLLKISKFLDVRKLSFKINKYIKSQKIDIDFIIQMIQYEIKTQKENDDYFINIGDEIEQLLANKINECLSKEKFSELPIQIIYRVISKASPNSIDNNILFDIIMKSISKFCILFSFLDLQKLSENRLEELCETYSKSGENTIQYFDYLKCNLSFIIEINKKKKNLQEENEKQKNKLNDSEKANNQLQNKLNDTEEANNQLQNKLNDSEKANNQLQNKLNDSEKANNQLQNKLNDSEEANNQLQNKLNDSEELNNKQLKKMKELEIQVRELQKQLDEFFLIKGHIAAKVENGLFISAEIDLKLNNSSLDMSKSKFIFSTSNAKLLGSAAYEKGEPITSFHMKTASYLCKPGTYFVRCIVFNNNGESSEIVSNSVTTSGSSATFGYEGKPAKISLTQGQYKLEVWGAKGGNSTGKGKEDSDYNRADQLTVEGGLGGYSRGILNLKKNETVYVYVGGEGLTADSTDGSCTKGGFPDGGGTKTGHSYKNYSTVPGSGGGSTSIRIGNDTNYARVIVAGGGGGASGSCTFIEPGGFGGGLIGGNCSYESSIKSQGAGTQTGSSPGLGQSSNGNGYPGQFGLGATGNYKNGCDSGGGGGGGWYGGGSGGYGSCVRCSSGGGGSGWIFTESSLKNWQSGDSVNASKFVLDSSYYLTDAMCIGGNEVFPRLDGNGTECGHRGHGYAKITPL